MQSGTETNHLRRFASCKFFKSSYNFHFLAFCLSRAEAVHIWRDGTSKTQTETHSAQAILDGFSYITDTISSVGAQPTRTISSWVADNIVNPSYWRANSEIICCKSCRINFQRNGLKIHHCKFVSLH